MPTNYNEGNSHKSKAQRSEKEEKPETFEKVVEGEVIVRKKPLGARIKDTFLGGDAHSVARYIAVEVLLPAFRNLLVDATTKGVERMVYGDSQQSRRPYEGRPRVTYNSPINRGYPSDPRYGRPNLPDQPSYPAARRDGSEVILQAREEAEFVLERLQDIVDKYEVASLSDLRQLVGLEVAYTDNKWGWVTLRGSQIRQIREGYLLDLPPVEPI